LQKILQSLLKTVGSRVVSLNWLDYGLDDWNSSPGRSREEIFSHHCPPSLLSNGYQRQEHEAHHSHSLMPRLRLLGATPSCPGTSSWRGTWLSRGAALLLT